jgi:hypothetical protein
MSSTDLTDSTVAALAAAVFDKPDPWVGEAYSEYDAEPLLFGSENEMASFARRKLAVPKGLAFFFVVYPDMRGRAVRETIRLKPKSVSGHELRYTWQGWGLISVQFAADPLRSRVAANSLARALKWQSTYPSLDPPGTWDWKAVASHARRLQLVLKSVTSRNVA